LTGGGTSGAITVGIQDATTSVKGAVQLSDSTSTTSSILAATPTAVKSAFDIATTANTNSNNITMVQQYTATESVLKNIPSRIPAAEQLLKQAVYWIDAAQSDNSDQVLDNQGWGGTSMTTQLGSTTSADSNDPKFLDFNGINYVYIPNAANQTLLLADTAAFDITGDLDLRVQLAMDDYTPAANSRLIGNLQSGGLTGYGLDILPSGVLSLSWGDGITSNFKDSTVATGITDGTIRWVRATLDVNNGAAGNDVKFFTSTDGLTWTQLGTTVTTALTTSIAASSNEMWIGRRSVSNDRGAEAAFYRAQILNGIDGTKVLDVDTSVIGSGSATSFTALTGQTVTISRATTGKKVAVVTHPLWLFGTDDYMEVADNALLDFNATDSFTVFGVFRNWATLNNGFRLINKEVTAGYRVLDFTTSGAITDGTNTVSPTNSTQVSGALETWGFVVNRSTNTILPIFNGLGSTTTSISSVGSLENSGALRIGSSTSGAFFANVEFVAAAIFRRVLTAAEVTTLTNYYTARVGA
jgi:hypothetical protein